MAGTLCPDRPRRALAVLAALLTLVLPTTSGQIVAIAVAGIADWCCGLDAGLSQELIGQVSYSTKVLATTGCRAAQNTDARIYLSLNDLIPGYKNNQLLQENKVSDNNIVLTSTISEDNKLEITLREAEIPQPGENQV